MESAGLAAASMLPVTSEAFGAVRRLRPAVNRDAAGTREPQAGNRLRHSALSTRSLDATTGDATPGRRDGAVLGSSRHAPL